MARAKGRRRTTAALDVDDAFIALLIAAMDASGHVSPEEAERAHHIIRSTRRFRHRSGETVGRKIERIKLLIENHGAEAVIHESVRTLPARLRRATFAIASDLMLVDGRMERLEGRFLKRLAGDLGLNSATSEAILDVMRIKNSA